MQLLSTFEVTAPIDEVWRTLMDFEKVAGCLPGAQVLNKLSDDAYQVGMKVKLGPVTMQYKGQLEVIERDEVDHRAVLKGQAKEARGQGTAQATATLQLVAAGETTRGTVHADVDLSGRAAAMGRGVIGSVTEQMMAQFAQNLQAMLNDAGPSAAGGSPQAPAPQAPAPQAPAPQVPAPQVPAPQSVAAAAVTAPPNIAARPGTESAAGASLDALSLARGMIGAQLRDPQRAVQLLVLVAIVSFKLGQRAARRQGAA